MKKNTTKSRQIPFCSFCGRTAAEGVSIVVGPMGFSICEECAQTVVEMASEGASAKTKENGANTPTPTISNKPIPTPSEMVAMLDQHVVGQSEVKKILATAVYNHYSRLGNKEEETQEEELKDVQIEKSNILMLGPTGCGKTLMAKTIAKMLDVPFAIADATTLTEAGYVGEDVENIIRYLYNNANGDIKKVERGICWVDEIDKIASKTQNVSITRDVSGEGVQQALLKIIEGTKCRFPPKGGRKHPDQELVEVDTSNILFICGGAFVGMKDIVQERIDEANGGGVVGFGVVSEEKEAISTEERVRPEDLVAYGLIPEFVGRLPIIAEMKELTEEELTRVLTEPKNSLTKQYRKLLQRSGIKLDFTAGALHMLAKKAIDRHTGARGLRAEMERVMQDIMFNAPDNKEKGKVIEVTESMVTNAA